MKKFLSVFLILSLAISQAACESSGTAASDETAEEAADSSSVSDALAIITDSVTTQAFTDEAVPAEDVETILTAGINSPSGMNQQP